MDMDMDMDTEGVAHGGSLHHFCDTGSRRCSAIRFTAAPGVMSSARDRSKTP
jgi:hypothetical protein